MNKKDNTYIGYLQNVVTNLPKTEEEKKKQKKYDILMAFLIISPMIISSVLLAFNYFLIGISYLILCWGICVIIGVNKRKQINKKFYKIENAHTKFNLVNVDDVNTIKELYKYFDGEVTLEEALDLIKKNSRRYAKRQYTFFNNQMDVKWFETNYKDFSKTIDEVYNYIKE